MKKLSYILCSLLMIFVFGCKQSSVPEGKEPENNATIEKAYPGFSPIGGYYKEVQTVTISHPNASAIYYTIDLSEPTEDSTLYTEPFQLSETTIVRAMAKVNDGTTRYAMTCFDFDTDRTSDYQFTRMSSPNWQDQVIYFLMLDRFYNGDTSNDNQNIVDAEGNAYNENEPISGQPVSGYNGGDFAGLKEKLQYIKDLGATAIWITPPIKNQVSEGAYHGFHGYWASSFTETDPHFGTLLEYQQLVKAAHDLGLYVIQDIVVNHTGDYMKGSGIVSRVMINKKSIPEDVFYLNQNSIGLNDPSEWTHPEQLPWKFNDPIKFTLDEFTNNAFYHYYPAISNFNDSSQTYNYQTSGLDDINTDNPVVANLLRGYFRYWIDKVDIDGYRIDTVAYVPPDFFEDFINSNEVGNKGIRPYAAELGKNDFLNFGEAWSTNEGITTAYTQSKSGRKRIDSVFYFPLTFALRDVVSAGSGTNSISKILNQRYTIGYADPDRLVTFVDNHDIERLITLAPENLVKASYALIMSLPGIPQVYYGLEQGFDVTRAAMFQGGYKDAGQTNSSDLFIESGEWYDFVKGLITLRENNRVLRYNRIEVLKDTPESAGIFAIGIQGKTESGSNMTGVGSRAMFIMNTSDGAQVMNVTPSNSNLKSGDVFELQQISSTGYDSEITVGTNGKIQFLVPAQSYAIYILKEEGAGVSDTSHSASITTALTPDFVVKGNTINIQWNITHSGTLKIVFNDNFTKAITVNNVTVGAGTQTCSVKTLSNGISNVQLVLESADGVTVYSEPKEFTIDRPYVLRTTIEDPSGDDKGPGIRDEEGKRVYNYSSPNGFLGTLDINKVEVLTSGNDIKLRIQMGNVSREWNPTANLFDHVMFSIMFEKPGSTNGVAIQPKHNYTLPNGFKWDYMLKAYGWSTSFYNSYGADSNNNGTSATPAPVSFVDWATISEDETLMQNGVVEFVVRAASLGSPESLDGWKIYINTYDMDFDQLRGMVEGDVTGSGKYAFGSGTADPATAPKVLDETEIITLSISD